MAETAPSTADDECDAIVALIMQWRAEADELPEADDERDGERLSGIWTTLAKCASELESVLAGQGQLRAARVEELEAALQLGISLCALLADAGPAGYEQIAAELRFYA